MPERLPTVSAAQARAVVSAAERPSGVVVATHRTVTVLHRLGLVTEVSTAGVSRRIRSTHSAARLTERGRAVAAKRRQAAVDTSGAPSTEETP